MKVKVEVNEFGERLKALRLSMGMTVVKMSYVLETTPGAISAVENGKIRPPKRLVRDVCEVVGGGPAIRRTWHQAAARAHGWEI
jgi:transcriptional regulator with XRE-family HTH domain